jgi:hypothetical protein
MIQPVHEEAFSAYASDDPTGLLVTLSGSTELESKRHLSRFLREVHEEACARAVEEVRVDFRTASFLNSTCLKVLASWILEPFAESKPQYRIVFITNSAHGWQRRSLGALAFLAPRRLSIVGDS